MFHHRFAPRPRDADHVEAGVALMQTFLAEKILRRLNHLLLLVIGHRFQRRTKTKTGAGFHFDKHNHPLIEHDEVQFTGGATIIALDYFETLLLEKLFGDALAFPAQNLFGIIHSHEVSSRQNQLADRLVTQTMNRRRPVQA